MKKQEVIDEIENAIPDYILNDFQRGKETGLTYALELVEELDEPEKPVVPSLRTGMKRIRMTLNITYTDFVSISMDENYMKIYMSGLNLIKINQLRHLY